MRCDVNLRLPNAPKCITDHIIILGREMPGPEAVQTLDTGKI